MTKREMTIEEALEIFKEVREDLIAKETELSKQVFENLGFKAVEVAIKVLEQQPNRCDSCTHSKEQDGSNCYECVKGMTDNFEAQPTDADCISRQELLSRIDTERKHLLDIKMDGAEHIIVHHARRIIEDMPSVTPTRPKGKWSRPSVVAMPYSFAYECPICRQWGNIQTFKPNYCPNCGAEMEIENEKETC